MMSFLFISSSIWSRSSFRSMVNLETELGWDGWMIGIHLIPLFLVSAFWSASVKVGMRLCAWNPLRIKRSNSNFTVCIKSPRPKICILNLLMSLNAQAFVGLFRWAPLNMTYICRPSFFSNVFLWYFFNLYKFPHPCIGFALSCMEWWKVLGQRLRICSILFEAFSRSTLMLLGSAYDSIK